MDRLKSDMNGTKGDSEKKNGPSVGKRKHSVQW